MKLLIGFGGTRSVVGVAVLLRVLQLMAGGACVCARCREASSSPINVDDAFQVVGVE